MDELINKSSIFFTCLHDECTKDASNVIDFIFEIYSSQKSVIWLFSDNKITILTKDQKKKKEKEVDVSISMHHSIIKQIENRSLNIFQAVLFRKITYSGNYKLLFKMRKQFIKASYKTVEELKQKHMITDQDFAEISTRLNSMIDVNLEGDEVKTKEKESEEVKTMNEKFIEKLFKDQTIPIIAKSITPETSGILETIFNLLRRIKLLEQNQSKSTSSCVLSKLFSFSFSFDLSLFTFLSKIVYILIFILSFRSVYTSSSPSNSMTSSVTVHLSTFILFQNYKSTFIFSLFFPSLVTSKLLPYITVNPFKSLLFLSIFTLRMILSRQILIYTSSLTVILSYFFTSLIFDKLFKLKPLKLNRIYSNLDKIFSVYLFNKIIILKSVFVKFGQYLGSRSDILPLEWSKVLEKLQDNVPIKSNKKYINSIVKEQFNEEIDEIFYEFDYNPIASASVAQVHLAYLLERDENDKERRGEKVAVKILHKNIESIIRQDMVAFKRIVRFICYLSKFISTSNGDGKGKERGRGSEERYEQVYSILLAWEKEILNELNFNNEAANIIEIRQHLKELKLISTQDSNYLLPSSSKETNTSMVLVPKLVKRLVSQKMFVMNFIEGHKLIDIELLTLYKVDKLQLLTRIVQIYGVQLFVKGLFNADPHPGNILLSLPSESDTSSCEVRPILLDFGMCIKLSDKERLGYCKLLFYLNELSVSKTIEGLKDIGYENSQSKIFPLRDFEFFLYLLRPTDNRENSKKATKEFREHRRSQRKNDFKEVEKSEEDEEEKRRDIEGGRYFKSFPDSLLFLFRVIGLIRGLCTLLDVKINYISIFSQYARYALLAQSSSTSLSAVEIEFNEKLKRERERERERSISLSSTISHKRSLIIEKYKSLEDDINNILKASSSSSSSSEIVGLQVSVFIGKVPIVNNLSYGELSIINKNRVNRQTLFPYYELVTIYYTMSILFLIQDKQNSLSLDTDIKQLLLDEECEDEVITLRDLLHSSTKIKNCISSLVTPSYLKSEKQVEKDLFNNCFSQNKEKNDGKEVRRTVYTHNLLMIKVIEKVSKQSIEEFLKALFYKLNLNFNTFSFGYSSNTAEFNNFVSTTLINSVLSPSSQSAPIAKSPFSLSSFLSASGNEENKEEEELRSLPLDMSTLSSEEYRKKDEKATLLKPLGLFGTSYDLLEFLKQSFKFLDPSLLKQLLSSADEESYQEDSVLLGRSETSFCFNIIELSSATKDRVLIRKTYCGHLLIIVPSKSVFCCVLKNSVSFENTVIQQIVEKIFEKIEIKDSYKLWTGVLM